MNELRAPPNLKLSFLIVRKNTILAAEEIPEDKYGLRRNGGLRNIGRPAQSTSRGPDAVTRTAHHASIAIAQGLRLSRHLREALDKERPPEQDAVPRCSRAKAIGVGDCSAGLGRQVPQRTFTMSMGQKPKTRFENTLAMKEHEMHHRGQLMLIQRMVAWCPTPPRARRTRSPCPLNGAAAAVAAKPLGCATRTQPCLGPRRPRAWLADAAAASAHGDHDQPHHNIYEGSLADC